VDSVATLRLPVWMCNDCHRRDTIAHGGRVTFPHTGPHDYLGFGSFRDARPAAVTPMSLIRKSSFRASSPSGLRAAVASESSKAIHPASRSSWSQSASRLGGCEIFPSPVASDRRYSPRLSAPEPGRVEPSSASQTSSSCEDRSSTSRIVDRLAAKAKPRIEALPSQLRTFSRRGTFPNTGARRCCLPSLRALDCRVPAGRRWTEGAEMHE
jgi:hypothetical protein